MSKIFLNGFHLKCLNNNKNQVYGLIGGDLIEPFGFVEAEGWDV